MFFILQRSGNRKEVRVDDAGHQASLNAVAPTGQSLLYIYREGRENFVGKAVGWNVFLDGTALAQLRSPRFTQTVLSPGPHTLAGAFSAIAIAGKRELAETAFEAQPGEVIVFATKQKMGARSNTLSFVREQDTRTVFQKLSKIPMVAAERAGRTVAG